MHVASDAQRYFVYFLLIFFTLKTVKMSKRAAASPMDNSEKQKRKRLSLSIAQKVTAGFEAQTRNLVVRAEHSITEPPGPL